MLKKYSRSDLPICHKTQLSQSKGFGTASDIENMEDPVVRRATITDMAKVLAIGKAIYKGTDYLPVTYPWYCHTPNHYMYVVETGGELVAFVNYNVINDGVDMLAVALRVGEDHQGRGLVNLMKNFARDDVRRLVPSVKNEVYTTIINESLSRRLEKHPETQTVPFKWRNLLYTNVPVKKLHGTMKNAKPFGEVALPSLTLEECDRLFQSQDTRGLLGRKSGLFVFGYTWTPLMSTIANLKFASRHTEVRASFAGQDLGSKSKRPSAVSFEHSCPIPGGFRSDLFFYGHETEDCLHHLEIFLRHIIVSQPRDIGACICLNIHIPLDVNFDEVEQFLFDRAGDRITSVGSECAVVCVQLS